jgi:pimeloyl-ACP methyl ester carboxylesterase
VALLRLVERGTGSPLLLLPGFGLSLASMAAVFEPVLDGIDAPAVLRLYVDLPGTGGSVPAEPTSESVLDAVAATVLGELGREPLLVLGWSYGGYLASGLARRLGGQVGGLCICCAGPKVRPEDRDLTGTLPSEEEGGWLAGLPTELHGHLREAVGRQTRAVALRIASALAGNGDRDEDYLARLRAGGFALPDEDAPARYDVPTTFLLGRRDRIAGFAQTVRSLDRYPDADLVLLSEAGHYLPLEEPERVRDEVRAWLRRCQRRSGLPAS